MVCTRPSAATPALETSITSEAICTAIPSAIGLRHEFPMQTNTTRARRISFTQTLSHTNPATRFYQPNRESLPLQHEQNARRLPLLQFRNISIIPPSDSLRSACPAPETETAVSFRNVFIALVIALIATPSTTAPGSPLSALVRGDGPIAATPEMQECTM